MPDENVRSFCAGCAASFPVTELWVDPQKPGLVNEMCDHCFSLEYPDEYAREKAQPDMVNAPAHYTVGGIETIDFIEAKGLGYHLANAIKYITRAEHKGNFDEDISKAIWYLTRERDRRRSI